MAVVNTVSNLFKLKLLAKEVDCDSDVFKVALMTSAFTFILNTHEVWADVSASEISAGNGYTTGGKILSGGVLTQSNTSNKATMAWLGNSFTGLGGDYPAAGSLIIYDDTHANKIILGCSDFGQDYTLVMGATFLLSSISFSI